MKFVVSLIILMFLLGSCGKKSEPKYKGSINNFSKTI